MSWLSVADCSQWLSDSPHHHPQDPRNLGRKALNKADGKSGMIEPGKRSCLNTFILEILSIRFLDCDTIDWDAPVCVCIPLVPLGHERLSRSWIHFGSFWTSFNIHHKRCIEFVYVVHVINFSRSAWFRTPSIVCVSLALEAMHSEKRMNAQDWEDWSSRLTSFAYFTCSVYSVMLMLQAMNLYYSVQCPCNRYVLAMYCHGSAWHVWEMLSFELRPDALSSTRESQWASP